MPRRPLLLDGVEIKALLFQKQTGTQERESVVDRDSPQKEVPVRDSEQGTNSVHGAEGLLSENSDGASGTSDFETPRRRQLGESPCEIGFRGERAEDPVLVHKVTLDPAYVCCVTRSSEVCERDYEKPQLPLAPAEASLAIGQKSISA